MRHNMRQQEEAEDNQSRVLYELCSMIIHTLKFPPLPFPFPTPHPYPNSSAPSSSSSLPPLKRQQPWWWTSFTSPASFATLFLGISFSLMLLGSVIFLVGLLLLPWVTLLVLLFYVAAFVSNLFLLVRFILGSISFDKENGFSAIRDC